MLALIDMASCLDDTMLAREPSSPRLVPLFNRRTAAKDTGIIEAGGCFMEIIWYGHSCFRMTERSMATVVADPYDYREVGLEPLRFKADIVTVSYNAPGYNHTNAVKGDPHPITGPGEYEIGGVFITGVQ